MGTVIIPFFKAFSHCDLYTCETLQYFALGTEIENKRGNVCLICNVVKYLYWLSVFSEYFFIGTNNNK
jgi:hypothetical protein